MGIIAVDNNGILSVAFDSLHPLTDESYVLASPDLTQWAVVASGTTGIITVTSGAGGPVVTASFLAPNGTQWTLAVDNTGLLTTTPHSTSLVFSTIGNDQVKLASGAMANGYLLFTYLTHTTTHATTYRQRSFDLIQPNPVVLNSLGYPTEPIFIETGLFYTFVLAPPGSPDPPVAPLYTWDDVSAGAAVNHSSITEWLAPTIPALSVSTTSFSVTGDQRVLMVVGRRIKAADATTLYGTIASRAFDGTKTVVTLALDSGVLSASLTSVAIALLNPAKSIIPSRRTVGTKTVLSGPLALTVTATFNLLPVGSMIRHSLGSASPGWLLCDGASYLRASYADLFAAIGTTYGFADGTHFNVPDRRGRFWLGLDNMGGTPAGRVTAASLGGANASVLGGTGGEEMHVTTLNETARHGHGLVLSTGALQNSDQAGATNTTSVARVDFSEISAGGNAAHNNMPPFEAGAYLIYARA